MNADTAYGPLVLWILCCLIAGGIGMAVAGVPGTLLVGLGVAIGLVQ